MFDSNVMNVGRGQRVDLTKNNPRLKQLAFIFQWSGVNIMSVMDHSAFLLDRNGRMNSIDDLVYRNNPMHKSESVEYVPSTKNAARLNIDVDKIPYAVDKIDFNLALYNSGTQRLTFGKLDRIEMLAVDRATDKELLRFDLNKLFSMETAIVVGEMYRHKGEWKFKAVGSGFNGGIEILCQNAGVLFALDD